MRLRKNMISKNRISKERRFFFNPDVKAFTFHWYVLDLYSSIFFPLIKQKKSIPANRGECIIQKYVEKKVVCYHGCVLFTPGFRFRSDIELVTVSLIISFWLLIVCTIPPSPKIKLQTDNI